MSGPAAARAAIIDPVRDYDPRSGKISTPSADRVLAKARERGLTVDWILETHAHADHLTAAPYLMFMCHDYKAPGRDRHIRESTVAEERARNIHVNDGVDEAAFVAPRTRRDATLAAPVLLLPSVQVNIRAGNLRPPKANGVSYLQIPVRPAAQAP